MDRARHCSLFSGHRGTGKSTELRRIAAQLHGPDLFHVVFLDLLREPMGGGRLQTPDVSLALCRRLAVELEQEGLELLGDGIRPLEAWLRTALQPGRERNGAPAKEAKADAERFVHAIERWVTLARSGADGLGAVHGAFRSGFDSFADGFNQWVAMARGRLKEEGRSRDLLFVLDGTDRIDGEDGRAFFGGDAHPLRRLDGVFVHCAPVQPIRPPGGLQPLFDHVVRLAPLTIHEKFDPGGPSLPVRVPSPAEASKRNGTRHRYELGPVPIPAAYDVMRQMILLRAPARFFDPDPVETGDWSLLDRLVAASGGHPRDLMRLLDHAFGHATGDRFDSEAVTEAIRAMAADYRRILEPDDYRLLAEIDRGGTGCTPHGEATSRLLANLALLEYDGDWWQSHPVIRTLPGYRAALEKVPAPG